MAKWTYSALVAVVLFQVAFAKPCPCPDTEIKDHHHHHHHHAPHSPLHPLTYFSNPYHSHNYHRHGVHPDHSELLDAKLLDAKHGLGILSHIPEAPGPYPNHQLNIILGSGLRVPYSLYHAIAEDFVRDHTFVVQLKNCHKKTVIHGFEKLLKFCREHEGALVGVCEQSWIPLNIYLHVVASLDSDKVHIEQPNGIKYPYRLCLDSLLAHSGIEVPHHKSKCGCSKHSHIVESIEHELEDELAKKIHCDIIKPDSEEISEEIKLLSDELSSEEVPAHHHHHHHTPCHKHIEHDVSSEEIIPVKPCHSHDHLHENPHELFIEKSSEEIEADIDGDDIAEEDISSEEEISGELSEELNHHQGHHHHKRPCHGYHDKIEHLLSDLKCAKGYLKTHHHDIPCEKKLAHDLLYGKHGYNHRHHYDLQDIHGLGSHEHHHGHHHLDTEAIIEHLHDDGLEIKKHYKPHHKKSCKKHHHKKSSCGCNDKHLELHF